MTHFGIPILNRLRRNASGVEGISSGIPPAECLNFSNAASRVSACNLRNLACIDKRITTCQKLCMGDEKRERYFHNLTQIIRISPHFCKDRLNHPSPKFDLSFHLKSHKKKKCIKPIKFTLPNSFTEF